MNTSNDSTGLDSSTVAGVEGGNYSPPVRMVIAEDGGIRYVPVQWEKDLVIYDLTLSQSRYPDGSVANLYANIKIDNHKNIIHDRFEILDL
jgi:hypothetical protein